MGSELEKELPGQGSGNPSGWPAMERIQELLDAGSFCELGAGVSGYGIKDEKGRRKYVRDGVITGYGTVHGHTVFVYSQDSSVCGGSLGLNHGKKIARVIEMAIQHKAPVIGINDSGGARIQEGADSLAGYGEVFYYNTLASGYIPQISIIAGMCAGGAVYSPGICDFIFMIGKKSHMFVTGSRVVEQVTGIRYTADELGGARLQSDTAGVAHFCCEQEQECFRSVRQLVSLLEEKNAKRNLKDYLKNRRITGTRADMSGGPGSIVPEDQKKVYDVKQAVRQILDRNTFMEVQAGFARNLVVGLGRLGGRTVGIVANQPMCMGGVLDCDASDKGARFVRFCDSFDIPLVTLVDVPGYMPGLEQEKNGIIRHGAKLLYAYAEATVPKLTVILRKAFGGAYIAMCSKHLRADAVYCWPGAQIAVMGAEAAVEIIHKKSILNAAPECREQVRREKESEYTQDFMNARGALCSGYVDEMIQPDETREKLISALRCLDKKKGFTAINKKHGNIPL